MRLKIALLSVARFVGLFALSKHITRKRVRLLCYHGGCIGDERKYNPKLFMSQALFRERMSWMQSAGFQFISLDEATDQARNQTGNKLRAVVTFDDGWYSTTAELLPVLAEKRIPSTLYLCTEHFLEGWPVASVTVRYLVWKSQLDRVVLEGCSANLDGEYDLRTDNRREQLISRAIKYISAIRGRTEVCEALERLAACLGISPSQLDLGSRRFEYASKQEIQEVSTFCSIQAHGHVHRYPAGAAERFAADLLRCSDEIALLGLPRPRHYCYPSGSYDREAARVLAQAGIVSATTCRSGMMDTEGRDEYYYLPRFIDGENVHQLEFEAEISGFSEIARGFLLPPIILLRQHGLITRTKQLFKRPPPIVDVSATQTGHWDDADMLEPRRRTIP